MKTGRYWKEQELIQEHAYGSVGRRLCLVAGVLVLAASCRVGYRSPEMSGHDLGEPDAVVEVPPEAPVAGQPEPIEAETIVDDAGTAQPRTAPIGVTQSDPVVLVGEVDKMGPFDAADAEEGQWVRMVTTEGLTRVLIPGALWARSIDLDINEGDRMRVRGRWFDENGARYLRATSVAVD